MSDLEAERKELAEVHTVYNEIAAHFSQTRYKVCVAIRTGCSETNRNQPWPIVEEFLLKRQSGQIGLDVGCGNGKYIGVNKEVFIIGSDRSDGLVSCAREFGHEVIVADGLALPHPDSRFDFAISIAVIHHFSTPERRTQVIGHILTKLKPGGEVLIYVWALEQERSRRGYKEGDPQDVLVPWVLQKKQPRKKGEQRKRKDKKEEQVKEKEEDETKYRYYHLYKQGELEDNAVAAGGIVLRHGYEKDNWYAVVQRPV